MRRNFQPNMRNVPIKPEFQVQGTQTGHFCDIQDCPKCKALKAFDFSDTERRLLEELQGD